VFSVYSSFLNQFTHLFRFFFAAILLFVVVPRLIFNKTHTSFEGVVANFIKVTLFFIVLGYITVILKLFEVLFIVPIIVFLIIKKAFNKHEIKSIGEFLHLLQIYLFDVLGKVNPFSGLFEIKNKIKTRLIKESSIKKGRLVVFAKLFSIIGALSFSAYLRFYDAVNNAAPAMSDAYVTLSWLKYISARLLFEGGIYPRGFHIILSYMAKFSFVDPIYVLKYAGPISSLLITGGLFFVVYKLTKSYLAGIVCSTIYGIFGAQILLSDWERQASTNSQEFALVFVLPAIYFFYKYIEEKDKKHLLVAFYATTIVGLVHLIPFALLAIGIVILIICSFLINNFGNIRIVVQIVIYSFISAIIAILPYLIGKFSGSQVHSSSSEYLLEKVNDVVLPQLSIFSLVGICSIIVIFLYIIRLIIARKPLEFWPFALIFSSSVFLVYYFGASITKLQVIDSRSNTVWALVLPLCIGLGFFAFFNFISNNFFTKTISIITFVSLFAFCLAFYRPTVILPYKMEPNSYVDEYLKIRRDYKTSDWAIISNPQEEYSIVYGMGVHLSIQDFVKLINPTSLDVEQWHSLPSSVFIYAEKKLFPAPFETQAVIDYKKDSMLLIQKWLDDYKSVNSNWKLYYEDEYINIYLIDIKQSLIEKQIDIWG